METNDTVKANEELLKPHKFFDKMPEELPSTTVKTLSVAMSSVSMTLPGDLVGRPREIVYDAQLDSRISAMEERLAHLEAVVFSDVVEVEIKERPYDLAEIKIEVKDYFRAHHGEAIDTLDLMVELNYPINVLDKACAELEQEGKIATFNSK